MFKKKEEVKENLLTAKEARENSAKSEYKLAEKELIEIFKLIKTYSNQGENKIYYKKIFLTNSAKLIKLGYYVNIFTGEISW